MLLDDGRIFYITDPHLGRTFTTGVPPHRKGERERMVMQNFKDLLDQAYHTESVRNIVIGGDLFDRFVVSNEVVLETYQLLEQYSSWGKTFEPIVILKGNHDASKDSSRVSSFDLLSRICNNFMEAHGRSVEFISEKPDYMGDGIYCVPWSYKGEVFSTVDFKAMKPRLLFTHQDIHELPQDLCPIINGHIHVRQTVGNVFCPGSMQPLAHGEGDMYITCTLDTIPEDVTNKCVRLRLKKGEEVPSLDCLQLTYQYVSEDADPDIPLEINVEGFSLEQVLRDHLPNLPMKEEVMAQLSNLLEGSND